MPGYHQISADRGQSQSQPQNQMTKRSKTLGSAIPQYHKQSHRRQEKTKRINKPGSSYKQQAVSNSKRQSRSRADPARGYITLLGPRVFSINIPIQITVKRHSRVSRE